MRVFLQKGTLWFSICALVLALVLFINPGSSGEIGASGGMIMENGNESWSLILLGASLIGFASRGLRKNGR